MPTWLAPHSDAALHCAAGHWGLCEPVPGEELTGLSGGSCELQLSAASRCTQRAHISVAVAAEWHAAADTRQQGPVADKLSTIKRNLALCYASVQRMLGSSTTSAITLGSDVWFVCRRPVHCLTSITSPCSSSSRAPLPARHRRPATTTRSHTLRRHLQDHNLRSMRRWPERC